MFKSFLLGITVLGSLSLVSGCGSSTSGTDPAGGGSGGSCNPVAFATLNSAGSNAKVCSAFVQCLGDKCLANAKECAGPDYATGVYTGTCGSYYDCVKTCNCAKACVDKCSPGTLDCAECLSYKLGYGCTIPCGSEVTSCGS
jgi:hypothetical protein